MIDALTRGDIFFVPKMPKPTPPWEEFLAAFTTPAPSTPAGSSSLVSRQRSSSDEAVVVPAGDVHLSQAAPLLPGGAAPSASALRQRQGHREALPLP